MYSRKSIFDQYQLLEDGGQANDVFAFATVAETGERAVVVRPNNELHGVLPGYNSVASYPLQIVLYHDQCMDGMMSKNAWHQGMLWAHNDQMYREDCANYTARFHRPCSERELLADTAPFDITSLATEHHAKFQELSKTRRTNVEFVAYKMYGPDLPTTLPFGDVGGEEVDWDNIEAETHVVYAPIAYNVTGAELKTYIKFLHDLLYAEYNIESTQECLLAFVDFMPALDESGKQLDLTLDGAISHVLVLDHHEAAATSVLNHIEEHPTNPIFCSSIFVSHGLSGAVMVFDMMAGIYNRKNRVSLEDISDYANHVLYDESSYNLLSDYAPNIFDFVSDMDTAKGRFPKSFAAGIHHYAPDIGSLHTLPFLNTKLDLFLSSGKGELQQQLTVSGHLVGEVRTRLIDAMAKDVQHVRLCGSSRGVVHSTKYSKVDSAFYVLANNIISNSCSLVDGDRILLDSESNSFSVVTHAVSTMFKTFETAGLSYLETVDFGVIAAPMSLRGALPHHINATHGTRACFSFITLSPTETKWSLRSKEVDCVAICKLFGGGGHSGASGFYTPASVEPLTLLTWCLACIISKTATQLAADYPKATLQGVRELKDTEHTYNLLKARSAKVWKLASLAAR